MFIDFFKLFDSIDLRDKEQIRLAFGLQKETFTITMMLRKNTKAIIRSSDGGTTFFDNVSGILKSDP